MHVNYGDNKKYIRVEYSFFQNQRIIHYKNADRIFWKVKISFLELFFVCHTISDGLKNPPIAVTTENDIPRRNDTNGDTKGVTEHYKDVKLDKVGEFQSKNEKDDQKPL